MAYAMQLGLQVQHTVCWGGTPYAETGPFGLHSNVRRCSSCLWNAKHKCTMVADAWHMET